LDDRQLKRLEALTGVPFDKLGTHSENRGPQISFDRPELSPCLSSIKNKSDPLYRMFFARFVDFPYFPKVCFN
jgi:hypothetical protein